jgi:hypothetical protein
VILLIGNFRGLLHSEDWGNRPLRNVCKYLTIDASLHTRRLAFSSKLCENFKTRTYIRKFNGFVSRPTDVVWNQQLFCSSSPTIKIAHYCAINHNKWVSWTRYFKLLEHHNYRMLLWSERRSPVCIIIQIYRVFTRTLHYLLQDRWR